ncbi:FUSC family protein [uncultured Cetobacterium sp.]|uniref:FUSC family protein n=1 Tax=uncultured Cetobacterium sp. TaxID=527638 RepID=UPI002605F4A8|nr:FUSC family protein [uncultured Cetobacterium sp.]
MKKIDDEFKAVINKCLRISISVFFCVYILKVKFDVNPFYASIAAVSCLQGDLSNSLKAGLQRCAGTMVGGSIGLLSIYLIGYDPESIHQVLGISLFLVIIIFCSTYLIKMHTSNTIACIVFLGIATNMDGRNPYEWAFKRILTTILGVVICLTINWILNGEYKHIKHTERAKKIIKKIARKK